MRKASTAYFNGKVPIIEVDNEEQDNDGSPFRDMNFYSDKELFSVTNPKDHAKKRTIDFVNSDFMNFKNNEARNPGNEFNARMNYNTMRSKHDHNNRLRECCVKSKGNTHKSKNSRSATMRNSIGSQFGKTQTTRAMHQRGKSFNQISNKHVHECDDNIDDIEL